jgi:hypothetical protein
MKKVTYLLAIIFGIAFFGVSCEKEDNPEGERLRIKKIADNIAMENPTVYEYNSDGLLIKVTDSYSVIEIEYNSNDLPIKIGDKTIEWMDNTFVVTDTDYENDKEIFTLNSKNQIVSEVFLIRENSQSEFDTSSVYSYYWTGNSRLKRICNIYPPLSEWNENWEDEYVFGSGISPFKGISIAVLVCEYGLGFGDWDKVQNAFCVNEYIENSDGYSATITYDFNEQNLPIRADIEEDWTVSTSHEYAYFEYEKY